jgi:prepilin-type N-terminal cleavage/methylation domain-containing protein
MADRKGFTLIEIIVVLVIVGVLAAIALPSFNNSIEKTKAQTAENNLLAITAAQAKYYEDYGSYCTATTGQVANCGDTTVHLNLNLNIFMQTDAANYSCASGGATSYTCTWNDGTVSLTTSGAGVTCLAGGSACPN